MAVILHLLKESICDEGLEVSLINPFQIVLSSFSGYIQIL